MIHRILRAWNAVQVELQGRYSLARLRAMLAYAESSSWITNILTIVLTLFPPLSVLLAIDALPLQPPELPFSQQTIWVTFRVFFACWLAAVVVTQQIHHSAPSLPLSTRQFVIATVSPPLLCVVYGRAAIELIGYPLPFLVQFNSVPWCATLGSILYYFWKDAFKSDPATKGNVRRYLKVFAVQIGILAVYSAYNVLLTRVSREHKTFVSFVLPGIKLLLKNWAIRGVFHLEDLAPSIIVFNVDAFHAMFVATSVQESASRGTITFIMAVDVMQSLIALVEIQLVIRRANLAAVACGQLDHQIADVTNAAAKVGQTSQSTGTAIFRQREISFGVVANGLHVINANPRIEEHPEVKLPRHLRGRIRPHINNRIRPAREAVVTTGVQSSERQDATRSEHDQVECVVAMLKVLHMIEFYVLIEFVEVAVPTIYAMSHMTNRKYYTNMKDISDQDLQSTVNNLELYAALELVSFVIFCVVVDRKLQHLSTIQQLAFVLRKNWRTTHLSLVLWVFFVVQLNFQHFGYDFTFRFEWLRRPAMRSVQIPL